jgi:hypothetical protein
MMLEVSSALIYIDTPADRIQYTDTANFSSSLYNYITEQARFRVDHGLDSIARSKLLHERRLNSLD